MNISRLSSLGMVGLFSSLLLSACSATQQPLSSQEIEHNPVVKSYVELPFSVTLDKYADQSSFCDKVTEQVVDACNKQNGVLQKQGRAQCYTCTIIYSDGGKACTDSSDCQGGCYNLYEFVPAGSKNQTGTCARDSDPFGCSQIINNGVAADAMCLD